MNKYFVVTSSGNSSEDWEPTNNTLICSQHFIKNKKVDHPNHPSYVPTIFPSKPCRNENQLQVVQRFCRLEQRSAKERVKLEKKKKIVEKAEDTTVLFETRETRGNDLCQVEIERELPGLSRTDVSASDLVNSVSCQTEPELLDPCVDESEISYFICNLSMCDNVCCAEVQVSIIANKLCQSKKSSVTFGDRKETYKQVTEWQLENIPSFVNHKKKLDKTMYLKFKNNNKQCFMKML